MFTDMPATFQRLMENWLGDLHFKCFIIYLDDVIIFSRTPQEHLQRLKGVFEKLTPAGLKLKPSKCKLFHTKLHYIGHVVSQIGTEADSTKITSIADWPIPKL